ncbi:MAG: glycoside hydrolase family 97 catalytic domain-containing protein [Bacteroidia bacterium]|nr:glycoside hydrolase family 97 catalytic domain-containing protein [Bacteroidia bacterium]
MGRKIVLAIALMAMGGLGGWAQKSVEVSSPDGRINVTIKTDKLGFLSYAIKVGEEDFLLESPLGLTANNGDFRSSMTITGSESKVVKRDFKQTRIKHSEVHYEANEVTVHTENVDKIPFDIQFAVTNTDVAFRYYMPKSGETGSTRIYNEFSGFRFPDATTTFMCPQSDAMVGWKRTKPSYEEEYVADAPLKAHSQFNHGFTFPCLFHLPNDNWALVSETGVDSRYCASHLSNNLNGVFLVEFPMPAENNGNGTVEPAFALPGATPWRTITLGNTLKPIVESTITWALVDPVYETENDYKMGKGTWSWILWQDESINYDDQVKYIDLAAAMNFQYVLIDNWWDTNIGREKVADLIKYAHSKGVDVFLWYSSSGYWNDIVQGPISCMDRAIVRKREMRWMKSLGVKGIKVDFFGGDKQETIRLYEDILSDADDNGLMVIFHGCTIPRGWERMYPNYVGSEAVLASENLIFDQHHCDEEGFRTTLYPFVRNAIGSMEYGGCFLNKRMHKSNNAGNYRKTSDVFQLSSCILFQNAIQNFAIAPNNLEDAPKECLDFLREVPTEWDETRLIDGYPGKYIVMARRSGERWYVAVTNGEKTEREVTINVEDIFGKGVQVEMLSDTKEGGVVKSMPKVKKGTLKLTIGGEKAVVLKGK